jgi:hypothetical protein
MFEILNLPPGTRIGMPEDRTPPRVVPPLKGLYKLAHRRRQELKWEDGHDPEPEMMMRMGDRSSGGKRMMRFQKAKSFKVTSPHYDAQTGKETVTIISLLKDESDKIVGPLR